MKRLQEIGNKYNRLPEQVEYDLMSILRWKNKESERPDIAGTKYYYVLIDLLVKSGCIEQGFGEYDITSEGVRVLRQGYLRYDCLTPKVEKQNKIRREILALWIAFLSLIVGTVGLFLPRHKTLGPDMSTFHGRKDIVTQDIIDLAPHADEINQATDSTKQ